MRTRLLPSVASLLNIAPWLLFFTVFASFGLMAPRFLEAKNLANILLQCASTGIVAVGMTFVLLTAGVDLSVGAVMFVAAAVAGKLALHGAPLSLALAAIIGVGLMGGLLNAFFIARLRIAAFIVTLATLYLGRGFALWLTQTRAMNLPESFLRLGASKWIGVPVPVWIFAIVLLVAHLILARTPYGRQVYAVGHSVEAARKAGLNTRFLIASVYLVSGFCAALGGIVALAQLGAVSPTFGVNKEFGAIAAAVLGGTSLFGGRGKVLPGTLLGSVLIQTIDNGLVIINADPYLYPLVSSIIIFLAVLLDGMRARALAKRSRRCIRMEEGSLAAYE